MRQHGSEQGRPPCAAAATPATNLRRRLRQRLVQAHAARPDCQLVSSLLLDPPTSTHPLTSHHITSNHPPTPTAQALAEKEGLLFMETSAADGSNVEPAFRREIQEVRTGGAGQP